MNKKFKRMLTTVSAFMACSLSTVSFSVFAVESDTLLDRVIKSYGEPSVIYKNGSETFIIKEDEQHLLPYSTVNTYINMKYPNILTDDIFDVLDDDVDIDVSYLDQRGIQYRLISESEEAESKAVEVLSKNDGILSIDKVSQVWGEPPFSIDGAWVKLDDNSKEIISGYEFTDYEYILGHWNDGTPIVSDEHKFVKFNSNSDCYEFVKKMQDNNIEYELSALVADLATGIMAEETIHLYQSDDYNLYFNDDDVNVESPEPTLIGDANEDGVVNMSDAVLIMQSITNPSEYELTIQGIANSDVVGNDGITLLDALRIQEMQVGK